MRDEGLPGFGVEAEVDVPDLVESEELLPLRGGHILSRRILGGKSRGGREKEDEAVQVGEIHGHRGARRATLANPVESWEEPTCPTNVIAVRLAERIEHHRLLSWGADQVEGRERDECRDKLLLLGLLKE